jgi:hypothetical protein
MHNVQIIDNYTIKSYKPEYPKFYEEVLAHDKISSSSWYELSDEAYEEYLAYDHELHDFYFIGNERKLKWPTLGQFESDWPDQFENNFHKDGAVYVMTWRVENDEKKWLRRSDWETMSYENAIREAEYLEKNNEELAKTHDPKVFRNCCEIIVACGPYGKPPKEWRPFKRPSVS